MQPIRINTMRFEEHRRTTKSTIGKEALSGFLRCAKRYSDLGMRLSSNLEDTD